MPMYCQGQLHNVNFRAMYTFPPFCYSISPSSCPQLASPSSSITCREASSTRPLRHAPRLKFRGAPALALSRQLPSFHMQLQCERKLDPVASRVDLGTYSLPTKQRRPLSSASLRLYQLSPPPPLRTACIHSNEVRQRIAHTQCPRTNLPVTRPSATTHPNCRGIMPGAVESLRVRREPPPPPFTIPSTVKAHPR
jgi:hypothetical protein